MVRLYVRIIFPELFIHKVGTAGDKSVFLIITLGGSFSQSGKPHFIATYLTI